ncbi:MAG TPA: DUF4158 domain-containing protein [Acidimicrobiales bacterium]|nr:DUF4158 domain-containing protein [Acidimicrobiales bacterium]
MAMQLCALPFLSFVPFDLSRTPPEFVARLAERVGVAAANLDRYTSAVGGRLRREHVGWLVGRAGWAICGRGEWKALGDWPVARALEQALPTRRMATYGSCSSTKYVTANPDGSGSSNTSAPASRREVVRGGPAATHVNKSSGQS